MSNRAQQVQTEFRFGLGGGIEDTSDEESTKPRSKCTNAPDKLQAVLTVESSQGGAVKPEGNWAR
jgi:hypothetical protein